MASWRWKLLIEKWEMVIKVLDGEERDGNLGWMVLISKNQMATEVKWRWMGWVLEGKWFRCTVHFACWRLILHIGNSWMVIKFEWLWYSHEKHKIQCGKQECRICAITKWMYVTPKVYMSIWVWIYDIQSLTLDGSPFQAELVVAEHLEV